MDNYIFLILFKQNIFHLSKVNFIYMTWYAEKKVQQATADQEHWYRKWGIVSSLGSQTARSKIRSQGEVGIP